MKIFRALRTLRDDEAGFTMVELIGAVSILAIGFLALMGTFSAASRYLVQSRQRQVASELANGRLEHVRNLPYNNVGLSSAPVRSLDPENPDYWVNASGTGYDYTHAGTYETLVNTGVLAHIEGPTTIGTTTVTVYQYVTWIDDPAGGATAEDYKRVTIVAAYSASANPGRPKSVQVSAFVTDGNVTITGSATTPTVGSTGSPTPTPSPTPTGSCGGDVDPPGGSFSILSGTGAQTGYTNSTTAQIQLSPVDDCTPIQAQFSNNSFSYGSWFIYDPVSPTVTWALASGDGSKSVWAHFKDALGNMSTKGPVNIILDQTKPTVPGTLARTASCSGNNRTVNLTWGSSTDTNLVGYRVYRQINGAGYQVVSSTATLTAPDTHLKSYDSVDFKITAYDKAGNEGPFTNVVSLAKNQCS